MTGVGDDAWRPRVRGPGSVASVGEAALLTHLIDIAAATAPGGGGGDDAATWSPSAGSEQAISIDAMVDGDDFRREWLTPRQLGSRAFHVAASDMAAMGALPHRCVVTLCVGADESADTLLGIQRGICAAAARYDCAVVGGDISATTGPLVIDVCVVGELPQGRALRRAAGRPGDALAVTGTLGRAAAGLRLLQGMQARRAPADALWLDAQRQGAARVAEGRHLLDAGVGCAGDLSDGLLVDAARTALCCGCAAEVWADALPVDRALRATFGQEWLQLAVGGGEDFELLVAAPPALLAEVQAAWPAGLEPLTVVGRLIDGSGVHLLDAAGGRELPLPSVTSRHFA